MWGATVYELAPGEKTTYHWHFGEEEWLIVLAGAPTLRTPGGEHVLRVWDTAVFPRGEAGAHQLRNDTDRAVHAVLFSTVSDPEVVVYPDEGRTGVIAGWTRGEPLRGWVMER